MMVDVNTFTVNTFNTELNFSCVVCACANVRTEILGHIFKRASTLANWWCTILSITKSEASELQCVVVIFWNFKNILIYSSCFVVISIGKIYS